MVVRMGMDMLKKMQPNVHPRMLTLAGPYLSTSTAVGAP